MHKTITITILALVILALALTLVAAPAPVAPVGPDTIDTDTELGPWPPRTCCARINRHCVKYCGDN